MMLGNSINYSERVEESRQVEKIKKVSITKALSSYLLIMLFVIMVNLLLADY